MTALEFPALTSAALRSRTVPFLVIGKADLVLGEGQSAIGTLVERYSRYLMLFPSPDGTTADSVRVALTETVQRLPEHLWQSLTWDQGTELNPLFTNRKIEYQEERLGLTVVNGRRKLFLPRSVSVHAYALLLHKPPMREVYIGTLQSRGAGGTHIRRFPLWRMVLLRIHHCLPASSFGKAKPS